MLRRVFCHGTRRKLIMYAITLSRSFWPTIKLGIVGCDVWRKTASARPVIPGVLATFTKGGASTLGDTCRPWHWAQCACAKARPARGSPGSSALTDRGKKSAKNAANIDHRMEKSPKMDFGPAVCSKLAIASTSASLVGRLTLTPQFNQMLNGMLMTSCDSR